MSWLMLALIQTATITLLLLLSTALLRRARLSVAASPSTRNSRRAARVRLAAAAPATDELPADAAVPSPTVAAPTAVPDDQIGAAVRQSWTRLREGFHTVLSGAQPVLQNSVWSELQRLLCAADQLFGVPSPTLEFRDEDLDADARWNTLAQGLTELRRSIADSGAAPDDATAQALLAALVQTVDELRHDRPVQAQPESRRESELRQMITQFTIDSRDMLTCIRRLESENADLRAQLEAAGTPPAG